MSLAENDIKYTLQQNVASLLLLSPEYDELRYEVAQYYRYYSPKYITRILNTLTDIAFYIAMEYLDDAHNEYDRFNIEAIKENLPYSIDFEAVKPWIARLISLSKAMGIKCLEQADAQYALTPGTILIQYPGVRGLGNFFAPLKEDGTTPSPSELGIGDYRSDGAGRIYSKEAAFFVVPEGDFVVPQSVASPIKDTWSIPGRVQQCSGGHEVYFINQATISQLIGADKHPTTDRHHYGLTQQEAIAASDKITSNSIPSYQATAQFTLFHFQSTIKFEPSPSNHQSTKTC